MYDLPTYVNFDGDEDILTLDDINIDNDEQSSSSEEEIDPVADHAPLWEHNRCIICGYIFTQNNIHKDIAKKVDHYYMS